MTLIIFQTDFSTIPTYDAGRIHICWGVLYVVTYLYSNVDIAQSSFFVDKATIIVLICLVGNKILRLSLHTEQYFLKNQVQDNINNLVRLV